MRLLAVETATEACSAALLVDGDTIWRAEVAPRRHAALILPMAQELLDEAGLTVAQLDLLAFGRGPGSFTGVRIAASVIQGIAFAADLPVMPISTLTAIAQGVQRTQGSGRVLAAIDARMGELYWSACECGPGGVMRASGEEQLGAVDAIRLPSGGGWCGAGSGWRGYGEILAKRLEGRMQSTYPEIHPQARDVAHLAVHAAQSGVVPVPAEQVEPVYLRNRVTTAPPSS